MNDFKYIDSEENENINYGNGVDFFERISEEDLSDYGLDYGANGFDGTCPQKGI